MTTKPKKTTPAPVPLPEDNVKRRDSEDAFRKFLEETELDADDEKAIAERIAVISAEGEAVVDDE